jgi:hypothetical protein
MYLLDMAIRPEALPTDAAALTEMVLALDAENEKLRVAMQTLKDMIFGKRSTQGDIAPGLASSGRMRSMIARGAARRRRR